MGFVKEGILFPVQGRKAVFQKLQTSRDRLPQNLLGLFKIVQGVKRILHPEEGFLPVGSEEQGLGLAGGSAVCPTVSFSFPSRRREYRNCPAPQSERPILSSQWA